MKACLLVFLAVGLVLFPFPRAVPAGDIPETPGVDNAARSGDAVQPAEPPSSGIVVQETEIPAEPPFSGAVAESFPTPPPAADNAAGIDNTWVDRAHRLVERGMFRSAEWLDHLVGGAQVEPHEHAKVSLWWRNDFRYDQLQDFTYRSAFRIGLWLPHLADRWRLVIAGESKGDPTAAIPVDPGNPGTDVRRQDRAVSAELAYDFFRTKQTFSSIGAGLKVSGSPDVFTRVRLGYVQPLGTDTLVRFLATAYYNALEGAGESNQLDFETRLTPDTLLRWSNSATIFEDSNGWEWGTELVLLHKLSPLSGLTVGASARGVTKPDAVAQNYRVYAGYRRSIFRNWLFCELEPDLNWPLGEEWGGRQPVWGATLRVELQFIGTEQALKIW